MTSERIIKMGSGDYRETTVKDNATYVEGNLNIQTKQNFEEISLKYLESQFQYASIINSQLLHFLKHKRLLVLGGELETSKNELVLHLALLLAKDIDKNITIQQWRRSLNQSLVDINLEFKNRKSPTIFILTDLTPQNVGSNWFTEVNQDKLLSQHYIIVTTDVSFAGWNLGENGRSFFPELKPENIYATETLISEFDNQLNRYGLQEQLKFCLKKEQYQQQKRLLVSNLKTPRNILRFIELFRKEVERVGQLPEDQNQDSLNLINLKKLIKTVRGDEDFIRKLYYDILSPREQLLAIGISFFNGLFEDQLFAALDQVVREVWQKRDPSLRALDYGDLEKLQDNYFKYFPNNLYRTPSVNFKVVKKESYQVDIRSVNIISRENRIILFKIAWEKQRRQIIAALDVLVKIIIDSVAKKSFYSQNEWELYGDSIRVQQLHNVISETISDIGLISSSAETSVRGALLTLAAQKKLELQDIAARAIARWYEYEGYEEKLFRTLQDLYSRTRQREVQIEINQENSNKIFKKRRKADRISKKTDNSSEQESVEPENSNNSIPFFKKIIDWFSQSSLKKETETETSEYKSQKDYYIGNINIELLDLVKSFELTIFSDCWYASSRIMLDIGFWRNLLKWKEQVREETTEEFTEDCIGATIAMTVSYAAIYDYNRYPSISNKFDYWIKEFSQSRVPLVHLYFGYYTLFNIVSLDFTESQDLLKTIAQKPEYCLHHAVALSLAHAHVKNSNDVQFLLSSWYKESINKASKLKKQITQRDALLKTVALSYGLLEYNQKSSLKVNEGFKYLAEILQQKENPFVREATVSAILNLTFRYFDPVESQLQKLVTDFTNNDVNKLINILTEIYLRERANQKGNTGEVESEKVEIKGRSYQIWKSPEKRPLISIEEIMNEWVKNENTAAQQIAIRALVSFANALDIIE